ncbi:two-component system, OmpR family, response regulator [Microbulbifer donghaiensis]|uniref:Two-component system, OmpR family, response regulator n=1 Tax=Microbulbifer donghaiensis TaxID=494016 RepID=A0A1M4UHG7_9GAMM|nr:response regulator transcription factor [Microbulbifer donghaiensis]SHE56104.1 two-component system, OmpR family, response regulator [Microbulbifer donghaiensis]
MAVPKACVLVVDDDCDIRDLIARLLTTEGYTVATAQDGEEMFHQMAQRPVDLVLLDVMLPGQDGFELCRQLHSDAEMPPVIMVTAKDDEIDRVVGLELGADDYIVKPFSGRELLARIKAVLRRARQPAVSGKRGVYRFSGWRFYPAQMELYDVDTTAIPLSTSETELLLAFVQNPQVPLSRDRLLDLTKGRDSFPFDRSIDSHVSRLRRKLGDDAKKPEIIKTAWGTGYMFTYPVEAE